MSLMLSFYHVVFCLFKVLKSESTANVHNGDGDTAEDVMGKIAPDQMTSKDYYFDSYAHFGIHEVRTTILFALH